MIYRNCGAKYLTICIGKKCMEQTHKYAYVTHIPSHIFWSSFSHGHDFFHPPPIYMQWCIHIPTTRGHPANCNLTSMEYDYLHILEEAIFWGPHGHDFSSLIKTFIVPPSPSIRSLYAVVHTHTYHKGHITQATSCNLTSSFDYLHSTYLGRSQFCTMWTSSSRFFVGRSIFCANESIMDGGHE